MARYDIERMIAEALGETQEQTTLSAPPPRSPLPHGEHILNQYVKLCGPTEALPDPSADVELPAAPAPGPTRKDRLSSVVKRAVARIKL